jgi:glycopeptide antibiotics resistance protein
MNGRLFFCRNAAKECFSKWSLKTAEYVKDGWLMTFGHVPMFFPFTFYFVLSDQALFSRRSQIASM